MIEWITYNKEWFLSGIGVTIAGALFLVLKYIKSHMQKKINVLMHKAYFKENTTPYYFIKVVNYTNEDLEITHVWLKTTPEIHVLRSERPLPYRLKPKETWETWIEESAIPEQLQANPYNLACVKLSTGSAYSSRENKDIPNEGFVASPNINS